ncbi:MAG TPA: aminoglycoside phosphotransferase family protein [Polyangiaceae bacterium]|nr:aminoglycoside phosphotransferase family protein [Polyangiaceae bacterium]
MNFQDREVDRHLMEFLARSFGCADTNVSFDSRQLRGGLVSPLVRRVFARYSDPSSGSRSTRFVVKKLQGTATRELDVYRYLSRHTDGLAPSLLDAKWDDHSVLLFLESVESKPVWPWRDLRLATRVLEKLASLHGLPANAAVLGNWNYDDELNIAASQTLDAAIGLARTTNDPLLRSCLPALRRLIAELPNVRRRLLSYERLPCSMIHGDVHPGNALVRRSRGTSEPLLIDWARARLGSPLEDVSSWIEWLAFWEFGAKRKHDTLLSSYLRARGIAAPPSAELRDAYWAASAINCCSGALAYHLDRAGDVTLRAQQQAAALCAAHHCLRAVRRAAQGCFVAPN